MLLEEYIQTHYGTARGNKAAFLRDNPQILPQELNRWINAKLKLNQQTGEIYKPTSKTISLIALPKVSNQNSVIQLGQEQVEQLQRCAAHAKYSVDKLLNQLIEAEDLRVQLLAEQTCISSGVSVQSLTTKIGNAFKGLSGKSEMYEFFRVLDSLVVQLLDDNLLALKVRPIDIAESERLVISRTAYYWYGGNVADRISKIFGTIDVYLWNEIFDPRSDVVFIGGASNVTISYLVCQRLCQLFKQVKTEYKKSLGKFINARSKEDIANDYMARFVSGALEPVRMMYDEDTQLALFEYAGNKYPYAMN